MKVVVLGANSFSGQDFIDHLLDDPAYEVIGVSRSPERARCSSSTGRGPICRAFAITGST